MIFVRFVVNFLFLQGIAAGQIILSAILNLEAEGDIFPFSFFLLSQEVSRRNTRSRA
jgi:hypothetical protein